MGYAKIDMVVCGDFRGDLICFREGDKRRMNQTILAKEFDAIVVNEGMNINGIVLCRQWDLDVILAEDLRFGIVVEFSSPEVQAQRVGLP